MGFLFIHLADFLEGILETEVGLLTPDTIKPDRRKCMLEELVYVWARLGIIPGRYPGIH